MTVILHSAGDFGLEDLLLAADGRSERIAPGPALALLAGRGGAEANRTLERVSRDPAAGDLRASALTLLWRTEPRRAEAVSLEMIGAASGRLADAALRGLGHGGTAAAFEPLVRIAAETGSRGRAGAMAALILAARLGLPGPGFSCLTAFQRLDLGTCLVDARIRKARRTDLRGAREMLADEPLDVRIDEPATLLLEGQGFEWLILPNSDRGRLLGTCRSPALLAVIAEWDPSDDRWFEGYLLLADAPGDGAGRTLALVDIAGEMVMRGALDPAKDDGWTFDIGAASPTMLHATLCGRLSGNAFEVTRFSYRFEVSGRRLATAIRAGSAPGRAAPAISVRDDSP